MPKEKLKIEQKMLIWSSISPQGFLRDKFVVIDPNIPREKELRCIFQPLIPQWYLWYVWIIEESERKESKRKDC
jgi:hypothetical protein